jgi:iron complex transport system substrate-binding protein
LFSLKNEEELVNRYLKVFLPLVLCLAIFPGLGCSNQVNTPISTSIEVIDQLGRTVKLEKTPHRIISLSPANTEILYALGLADRVVAVTDYDNYPPEVKQKESIGDFSTPNLEKVVSLSPDLVIASPIHEEQVIPQLETKGINVMALTPATLDEVLAAITLVGKVTGVENKASDLVTGMQKRIKAVVDKTGGLAPENRPKVFFIIWHDPLMASGLNTFHDELIKKAGGVNMVTDEGYPSISLEIVVQSDPDVILAGVGMGEGMDAPLKFAQEEPRLRDIAARKNNRIYGVNSDITDRAGPRIIDALEEFAQLIHPELFK